MTHGSLFSGIGGFDLAAEWAGWTNVFNCENEPFCKQILKYHFPNAIQYDDIKTTDFTPHRGTIDIVSGGFPCQPFSQAGKQKGTADNRYLWAEMLRAIREIAPRWVVAENVRGIITIEQGMVFERVQADLENAGYAVQSFVVPACAVGAPHERYRTFFVAHRTNTRTKSMRKRTKQVHQAGVATDTLRNGRQTRRTNSKIENKKTTEWTDIHGIITRLSEKYVVDNTTSNRPQTGNQIRTSSVSVQNTWFDSFPTFSPVCWEDDGFPTQLDGITIPKWRSQSIQSFGNAVVPYVPYVFFEIINEIEKYENY